MRVVVLGAGVIGVSAAYFLAKAGHQVHVIDRQPGAGLETSFANGGQISASHAEPWANPTAPVQFLRWLGRADAPVIFRPRLDPAQWAWGLTFMRNCAPGRTRANTEKILRLALYSRAALAELMAETAIQFDHRGEGIMHIYRDRRSLERAARTAHILAPLGCAHEILDATGCVEREPALAASRNALAGAIYSPDDASGDAHVFTQRLAEYCASLGVEFSYETEIGAILAGDDRVVGVETTGGKVSGDSFVLCLGSYTPLALKPLGLKTAIYPAKGYSVTLPTLGHGGAPTISLTDDDNKLVYSRLGDRLRIAGMAEFAGHDERLDPRRAQLILRRALALFPDAGDGQKAEFWTGLRPLTPDGAPVIGATPYRNLFINSGHGTLGWTLSCGSARLIADLVGGREPDLDLRGYAYDRF